MRDSNQERLYNYLPAIYRRRDQEVGEPLRALLAIMEDELAAFENEIDAAYRNAFIETCDTWVIPYIADLLGIRGLHDENQIIQSQRPRVANTLRYRRRKGQANVLERVISDVTGWRAKAVEFFRLISTNQHMQHIRPGEGGLAHIRDINAMETLNTAFDRNAHTPEIRDPERYAVKYNLNNIGLFVWRLQSFPITEAFAKSEGEGSRCYKFHPLGLDTPLYNRPQPISDLEQIAEDINLPVVLRPAALTEDLNDYRERYRALAEASRPANSDYYGPERAFYLIKVANDDSETPVLHDEIVSIDLSDWANPPANKVAVDVNLGRIKLGSDITLPKHLKVNYHYGFSADIGGGHYDRQETLFSESDGYTIISVAKNTMIDTLQSALTAISEDETEIVINADKIIIQIEDDATYGGMFETIKLVNNSSVVIQAADGARPCLRLMDGQKLKFLGDGSENQVTLNGLLMEGGIELGGKLNFNFLHCTSIPISTPSIAQIPTEAVDELKIVIDHGVTGLIELPSNIMSLTIRDSVIDAKDSLQSAIRGELADGNELSGPRTRIERTTVFGNVRVLETPLISESIITGTVNVDRIQVGCIRYSSLTLFSTDSSALLSRTPPRYRCQPELDFIPLAEERAVELGLDDFKKIVNDPNIGDPNWWKLTLAQLQPQFSSTTHADPDYAQLSRNTHVSLLTGTGDGSEMGVFKRLRQPQREANLQGILDEFLPFGLTAKIFFVN